MSYPYTERPAPWDESESHLISEYAYTRFIEVEPVDVLAHIVIWRQWYHGLVPQEAVLHLPRVRRITVSGR